MFTGIIQDTGHVQSIVPFDDGLELTIRSTLAQNVKPDDSISIDGVCQTVIRSKDDLFVVQAVQETLRKTNFGALKEDRIVNLERPLTMSRPLDGHVVLGHVDTIGHIVAIEEEGSDRLITVNYPPAFARLLVGRGSIAVNGISLTIARLAGESFTIAVIPYTFDHTNIHILKSGDVVNLEFDILGKYVARNMELGNQIGKKG